MKNLNRLKILRRLGRVEIESIATRRLATKRMFWKTVKHLLKKPRIETT